MVCYFPGMFTIKIELGTSHIPHCSLFLADNSNLRFIGFHRVSQIFETFTELFIMTLFPRECYYATELLCHIVHEYLGQKNIWLFNNPTFLGQAQNVNFILNIIATTMFKVFIQLETFTFYSSLPYFSPQ